MTAKKKARELQHDLMDSAHKIWLAGLGAMAVAEEEGRQVFKNLVERGEDLEKRGREQTDKTRGTFRGVRTVAESYWETLARTIDEQTTAAIHRIGVPTKDEIETLTKKVESLTKSVEKLRSQQEKSAPQPAAKRTPQKKTVDTTKK